MPLVMKEAKDLFSKQADTYAAYRPSYPPELYKFLYSLTSNFGYALDCATGNGHNAAELAKRFKQVYAIDISKQLLRHATEKPNLIYKIERAENTSFLDDTFDLITVATALHWFDHKAFFSEVKRIARNKAAFAAWAYAPLRIGKQVDSITDYYYSNIVGPYWDAERKYVDEEYKTIPFQGIREVGVPSLSIVENWNREHFIGFLSSWSSTQNYINHYGTNPVDIILADIKKLWRDGEILQVKFPLFMRAGYIVK